MDILEPAMQCYAATIRTSRMVSRLFMTGLSQANHGAGSPSPSSAHMVYWLQLITMLLSVIIVDLVRAKHCCYSTRLTCS